MSFSERLKTAIKSSNLNQKELSTACGISPQAISNIIRGVNKGTTSEVAGKMAKALGVDLTWLLTGDGVMRSPESNVGEVGHFELWSSKEPLPSDEYVSVPFLKDVEFQGGAGAFAVEDYNDFKLPFAKSTLYRKNVSAKDAICVTLTGDSMEPVMPKGTSCGINTADKVVIDGDHYAINHGGLLRIKKLYRLPNNQVRINSWNEVEHADEIVSLEEIEIVGKVFYWSVLP